VTTNTAVATAEGFLPTATILPQEGLSLIPNKVSREGGAHLQGHYLQRKKRFKSPPWPFTFKIGLLVCLNIRKVYHSTSDLADSTQLRQIHLPSLPKDFPACLPSARGKEKPRKRKARPRATRTQIRLPIARRTPCRAHFQVDCVPAKFPGW
jgi:hypothetical protein